MPPKIRQAEIFILILADPTVGTAGTEKVKKSGPDEKKPWLPSALSWV